MTTMAKSCLCLAVIYKIFYQTTIHLICLYLYFIFNTFDVCCVLYRNSWVHLDPAKMTVIVNSCSDIYHGIVDTVFSWHENHRGTVVALKAYLDMYYNIYIVNYSKYFSCSKNRCFQINIKWTKIDRVETTGLIVKYK
jgi:hypothetical protein